jgi:hypothetical protein
MNECMRGIEKWSVVSITYLATRACPSNYLHHDGPAEVSKYFRRVFHKTLKQELSCSRQSSTVYKKRTVLWDPARRLVLREICTMRKVNEMACIAECHLIAVTETTLSFLRESRRWKRTIILLKLWKTNEVRHVHAISQARNKQLQCWLCWGRLEEDDGRTGNESWGSSVWKKRS